MHSLWLFQLKPSSDLHISHRVLTQKHQINQIINYENYNFLYC